MTTIDREEIEKVAHLARLDLPADELGKFSKELSDILNYIERLSAVDTEGVEPLASSLMSLATQVRPDLEDQSQAIADYRDKISENAPEMEGRFLKVPKMSK